MAPPSGYFTYNQFFARHIKPGMRPIAGIADDIANTREDIKRLLYFEEDINVVGEAADGQETITLAAEIKPDVILMDINMPRLDGIAATEQISVEVPESAIIIVSIQKEQDYLRRAMAAGARDYLVKPFDVDELDARLRALLRRAAGRASPTIRYGDIEVDPAARTVVQGGKPVEMSPREFSVLLVLLQARGRVLSRQQLEERLYSWQSAIESNAVEVHIHHLRRKLGSGCIQTMRGVGYFMPQEAA